MFANSGPQYWPFGTRSLDNHVESNVFDLEALFQKEFQALGRHRFSLGASSRLKRLSWDYIGVPAQELHFAAFIQEEWRPIQPLFFTGSYRLDRHPLLDNGNPGFAHSPRVSAVWIPFEGHSLHASFATAFRAPTFLESYTQLVTPAPGINGASVMTLGSTTSSGAR